MATGLGGEDCSLAYAWLDPVCDAQNLLTGVGSGVGTAVTSALEPVWIILAVVAVLIIIILFAPNTKHIIPHLSFL
jgi:hypothetical protein